MQLLFKNQPDNVQVFWSYGSHSNEIGDYIKKTMTACSGEEILHELCYHFDLLNKYEEMRPHFNIKPVMTPYITSQFMPRKIADRPKIVSDGGHQSCFYWSISH